MLDGYRGQGTARSSDDTADQQSHRHCACQFPTPHDTNVRTIDYNGPVCQDSNSGSYPCISGSFYEETLNTSDGTVVSLRDGLGKIDLGGWAIAPRLMQVPLIVDAQEPGE